MASLNVRDIPKSLHESIRRLARASRRSLRAEVIELLDHAVSDVQERVRMKALLADMKRTRIKLPPGTPTAEELIREDRDR